MIKNKNIILNNKKTYEKNDNGKKKELQLRRY